MSAPTPVSEHGTELRGIYRLGGISLVAAGILFLSKYVLELVVGPPGADVAGWRDAGDVPIALANEILFFAAMLLIPGVIALYWSLGGVRRATAAAGCGVLAAAIPVILALDIVHGRLVYPIYGYRVDTPAAAELVVAIYFGGLHATLLMFAVATAALSLAMRHSAYGRPIVYLGFITAASDVVGAYPEAIGPAIMFVSQVLLAVWFVAVGASLYRMPKMAPRPLTSGAALSIASR